MKINKMDSSTGNAVRHARVNSWRGPNGASDACCAKFAYMRHAMPFAPKR